MGVDFPACRTGSLVVVMTLWQTEHNNLEGGMKNKQGSNPGCTSSGKDFGKWEGMHKATSTAHLDSWHLMVRRKNNY